MNATILASGAPGVVMAVALTDWLEAALIRVAQTFPEGSFLNYDFMVRGLIAAVLVGVICGAVGPLVVGNRMAFFSDALAHCAFAGVVLGIMLTLALGGDSALEIWLVPSVMIGFGVLVGFSIAYVREHTSLSSDTIIGVFFAFATGFGVMFMNILSRSSYKKPDNFLFGSPLAVFEADLLWLAGLLIVLVVLLSWGFNSVVFGSFSPTLARSRGLAVRAWNYAFIVVLALIVNLCLKAVGWLLINALLVVPAATAANLGRSTRGMFWWSVVLSVTCSVLGLYLSFAATVPLPGGGHLELAPSGTVIVLTVTAFFVSLIVRMRRDRRRELA